MLAVDCLDRILNQSRKADMVLSAVIEDGLVEERDKQLLHEMVYGVLRRYFSLEADASRFLKQKPDEFARLALLLGTYQIRHMRMPVHAAVGETVEAVKTRSAKSVGMLNAVLRKVSNTAPPKKLKPYQRAELPQWMYALWRDAFSADAVQSMAQSLLHKPQLCLAVFEGRQTWMQQAQDMGVQCAVGELSEHAVLLPEAINITALPGFAQGEFQVMDQAAQAAVLALEVCKGDMVLDICAAPGGKTALLAKRHTDCQITAIEKNTRRLPRLQENMQRMQLPHVQLQQADASCLPFADNSIDAILLDAPCTASGVLRKHPDAKFLQKQHDVQRHALLQQQLLQEALRVLKPSGHLVYAVCSIHPQENEQVVESMAGLQSMQRFLPTIEHDGFFIATFRK